MRGDHKRSVYFWQHLHGLAHTTQVVYSLNELEISVKRENVQLHETYSFNIHTFFISITNKIFYCHSYKSEFYTDF